MKKIGFLMGTALATISAFGASCCAAEGLRPEAIRMMSYNVHHCAGSDRKVDIPRVAATILREKPDFVGLQELDCRYSGRSGKVDQSAELGRLTGMQATFAAAIPRPNNGGYGVGVLSKEKPLSVVKLPLPGREPRVLLLCEFKDFWFGVTHLALQSANRVKSVEIIRRAVEDRASRKPVFLTGDLNANPQSKTLAALRGFTTILSKERCRTFHGFKNYSPGSESCIDYVAVSSASPSKFDVRDAYVIEDKVASDHFPIVVDVVERVKNVE